MSFRTNKSFEFTAHSITSMNATVSFLLTYCVTMELLFSLFCFITLYFSLNCTASAKLLNNHFAVWAPSLMTYLWALMSARKFFLTGHSTTGDWVFTTLSFNFGNHHQLVATTRTSFLEFRSLFT